MLILNYLYYLKYRLKCSALCGFRTLDPYIKSLMFYRLS